MKKTFVLLAFLFLALGCSERSERRAGGAAAWERVVARGRFSVSAPATIGQKDVESVLLALETAERKTAARHKLTPPPVSLQAKLYRTTPDFTAATGAEHYMGAFFTGGVLHLQPVRALRDRGILQQTVTHEYVHFYLNVLTNGNTPAWLDEGIATLVAGEHGNCESGRAVLSGFDSFDSISAALAPGEDRGPDQDAYLAACFAVAFIEKSHNGNGLSRLLSRLRQDRDIDSALLVSTGLNSDDLFTNISANGVR